jgi:hypothetical protein
MSPTTAHGAARSRADLVMDGDQGWVRGLGVTEARDEVEAGR